MHFFGYFVESTDRYVETAPEKLASLLKLAAKVDSVDAFIEQM